MLATLRDLPDDAAPKSWEIDWENFDWSDVETGGPLDPNMRVVWPLKLVSSSEIMRRCAERQKAEPVAKILGLSDAEINELEQRRQVLRAEKKFQEADAIRNILRENGVDVMDGKVS